MVDFLDRRKRIVYWFNSVMLYAQGPVLVLLAYFLAEHFQAKGVMEINALGAVFAVIVVLAVFAGGFWPGLVTALVAAAVGALSFSLPRHWFHYSQPAAVLIGLWLIAFLAAAILAGWLKRQSETSGGSIDPVDYRDMEEGLLEVREELNIVLNGIADAVIIQDPQDKIIYANELAARQLGFAAAAELLQISAKNLAERLKFHNESGQMLSAGDLPGFRAMLGQEPPPLTLRRVTPGGESKWAVVKARPVYNKEGKVVFAVNIFRDITIEKHRELADKRSNERERFLSQAGEILSSSLDYEQTLSALSKLAVPEIADWCAVDLVEGGILKRVTAFHADPEKVVLTEELVARYPIDLDGRSAVAEVVRSGKTLYLPQVTGDIIRAAAKNEEHLRLMEAVGLKSLVIIPLKARQQVIGVLILAGSTAERRFAPQDVSLAKELARRAALAIENSQLYSQARLAAVTAQEQTELFDSVLANAPVGFAFINLNFEYERVNACLAKMLGVRRAALTGTKLGLISPEVSRVLVEQIRRVFDTRLAVAGKEVAGSLVSDPRRVRHWVVSIFPVYGANHVMLGAGMIVDEVTEEKRVQADMNYYATHDTLTGLPNRKLFEEYLSLVLAKARESGNKVAVMILDLDRFKNVNDSLGHEIGDRVMKEVAARLTSNLRQNDLAARWGGDEFVIVLPDLAGIYEATRVADKILKAFNESIHLDEHTLHVFTTIGVALYPRDGIDGLALLKNADAALYRAKELGKNRFEFYDQELRSQSPDQLVLEAGLREGFKKQQLRLYFQPIVELESNSVIAVEALVRWQHPSLGLIKPGNFIPLAENVGLIVPIGKWIINNACEQAQAWAAAGLPPLQVAVNLSTRQFIEDSLVSDVEEALGRSGLDPRLLELEITESLAMENVDRTRHKIIELGKMGVGITVDDFGTGYSSLSYLKSFPVDKLKIDKSFVKHCITEEQDAKIIRAIVSMADSLNLKVIAEGVDTDAQIGLLKSFGCYAAQGYCISKPLAAPDFEDWLRERIGRPRPPSGPARSSPGRQGDRPDPAGLNGTSESVPGSAGFLPKAEADVQTRAAASA